MVKRLLKSFPVVQPTDSLNPDYKSLCSFCGEIRFTKTTRWWIWELQVGLPFRICCSVHLKTFNPDHKFDFPKAAVYGFKGTTEKFAYNHSYKMLTRNHFSRCSNQFLNHFNIKYCVHFVLKQISYIVLVNILTSMLCNPSLYSFCSFFSLSITNCNSFLIFIFVCFHVFKYKIYDLLVHKYNIVYKFLFLYVPSMSF